MKFYAPTADELFISLTSGHTAVIPPEGVELDKMFHREAIANGALTESLLGEKSEPADPQFDRKQVIVDAMNAMLDGGSEDDFTNDGRPDLRRLNARVGFTVSRSEADAIWREVSAA